MHSFHPEAGCSQPTSPDADNSDRVLCRNIYHTLVHGVGCIFTTLSELGLLPDTVTRQGQFGSRQRVLKDTWSARSHRRRLSVQYSQSKARDWQHDGRLAVSSMQSMVLDRFQEQPSDNRAGMSTPVQLTFGSNAPSVERRMLQQDGETPSNCTLDKPSPGVLFLAKSAKQLRDKRAFLFDGLGAQRCVCSERASARRSFEKKRASSGHSCPL